MTIRTEAELPHHFGSNKELFGIYHPTTMPAARAVLLCPPLGQDLVRCHRLYRQLAHALVAEGIAALRFDYYGSGDSAGDSADLDWTRCLADTLTAAAELRELSGCSRIIAFGARLGASLAISAAVTAKFSELIVWDPVLDGVAHVARLDELQTALRCDPMRFGTPRSATAAAGQWLGYATAPHLRQQLLELHPEPSTLPTLLLDSLPVTQATRDCFVAAGATVVTLQQPTPWDELDRLELAILSHPLIQAVSGHLREAS